LPFRIAAKVETKEAEGKNQEKRRKERKKEREREREREREEERKTCVLIFVAAPSSSPVTL